MARRSIGQEQFGFAGRERATSSLDALVLAIDWNRSHTARTAGRLRFGDFLVSYERFEVLDAVVSEGHITVFVF